MSKKSFQQLVAELMEALSEEIESEKIKEEEDFKEVLPWYASLWDELHTEEQLANIKECSYDNNLFECISYGIYGVKNNVKTAFFDKNFEKIYFFDNGLLSYNGKELVCESMDKNAAEFAKQQYSKVHYVD
jgi:hypothetical protein